MTSVRLERLCVYPVKSLRGIDVDKWPITAQGLQYDRQWMLIMPNGRFVSQRQLPTMALIDTAIEGQMLVLSRSGLGEVRLPLVDNTLSTANSSLSATIWRDECDVAEASAEASAWLSQVLQAPQPLRLVRMAPNHQRVQSQPQRFGDNTHTYFADAAPFLISNTNSLTALNSALQNKGLNPVDDRRFRANIVISGLPAFAEHQVDYLSHHSGERLVLRDHCERCIMTTIDPDTGIKDPSMEPFRTLATLNPNPNNLKAPTFGVNATWMSSPNQPVSYWRRGDTLVAKKVAEQIS